MSIKVRSSLLSLAIIAVLIFSAVGPTIVYADGGTSTDTPPTETTTNECTSDGTSSECPTEVATAEATATPEEVVTETTVDTAATAEQVATETPTDTAATSEEVATETTTDTTAEEPAATAEAVVTDESVPSAEATAVPATEEAPPATEEAAAPTDAPADTTVLNDIPENTTVEVVNADGQSEPLATQAAADAIATTSDPFWCPQGQAPIPGANNCTASFTSFNLLLTFLAGNATYQGAGTIYVQQGAYQGGESSINFNNYNLSNISNNDLTIQGGWNTNNTVDLTATSTFNNIPILIGGSTNPWGGSLTINNITLMLNQNGQGGTGLVLNSQTDINISNVTVMNSATGAGAELTAVGDITIKDSKFDRNKTAGAIIRSTGPTGNVTIANSSFSNPVNGRRQVTGLDIVSGGSVSLFDVLANENREVGATIKAGGPVAIGGSVNPFTGTATTSFSGTKIIKGSTFLGYGLQVETPSDIAITNVVANDNFLWGASLHAGGNINISESKFNANTTASPGFMDDTGLIVTSGGIVNISHIEANNNRLMGATITATRDVSILNSFFNNNNGVLVDSAGTQTFHGEGLRVLSGDPTQNIVGNITLTNVITSNNTLDGAHLEANGDVTISDSTFSNNTTSNNPTGPAPAPLGRGLEVISGGNVFLSNVVIDNNETFGANIKAGGDIFLTNVTATNNKLNGVEAQGNCTTLFLINGNYSNNGQYGLSIINAALNQTGSPIFAGNVAGNIFQDPGTCVFPVAPFTPPTPPVDNTGSTPTTPSEPSSPVISQSDSTVLTNTANYTVSYTSSTNKAIGSTTGISSSLGKVTLSSFLANTKSANRSYVSIFMGKYFYIDSLYGLEIFVYSPSSLSGLAMVGPH